MHHINEKMSLARKGIGVIKILAPYAPLKTMAYSLVIFRESSERRCILGMGKPLGIPLLCYFMGYLESFSHIFNAQMD